MPFHFIIVIFLIVDVVLFVYVFLFLFNGILPRAWGSRYTTMPNKDYIK